MPNQEKISRTTPFGDNNNNYWHFRARQPSVNLRPYAPFIYIQFIHPTTSIYIYCGHRSPGGREGCATERRSRFEPANPHDRGLEDRHANHSATQPPKSDFIPSGCFCMSTDLLVRLVRYLKKHFRHLNLSVVVCA